MAQGLLFGHQLQDALKHLHITWDPEGPLMLEPKLLLCFPEELLKCPVPQVLCGDHKPPHLLPYIHCKEPLGDRDTTGVLVGPWCRCKPLPPLEQLLQPHYVSDLVACPGDGLLLHGQFQMCHGRTCQV